MGYFTAEAERQAEAMIHEQVEENLPSGYDEAEWNWQALSNWVNRQYKMNTNASELKKIGREEVGDNLIERARQAIDRYDFSGVDLFLDDDFCRKQLQNWLHTQFTIDVSMADLKPFEEAAPAAEFLKKKARERYRQQEIQFPVSVAMNRFVSAGNAADREGLYRWATGRFQATFSPDEFREKPLAELETLLKNRSASFFPQEELLSQVETHLNRAFPANGNGRQPTDQEPALRELISFANQQFEAALQVEDLKPLPRQDARQAVLQSIDRRFRPELRHAEHSLLLHILDASWKDHLYSMDNLKQGIHLESYAQKDPKVEYKRQGMTMFHGMWDRIAEQVTQAVFRMEHEAADFVGSLWQITSTTHQAPESAADEYRHAATQAVPTPSGRGVVANAGRGGDPVAADAPVVPIHNRDNRVGRNDLCPCGSGKKYKKCHGAG